jgi:hypothetical protein
MFYEPEEPTISFPEAEAEADGILIRAEALLEAPAPAFPCKVRDASEIPIDEQLTIIGDHLAACDYKRREGGEVHAPPPPRHWKRNRPGNVAPFVGGFDTPAPTAEVIPFPPLATEIEPIEIVALSDDLRDKVIGAFGVPPSAFDPNHAA